MIRISKCAILEKKMGEELLIELYGCNKFRGIVSWSACHCLSLHPRLTLQGKAGA
jgi:hypothetical protein